MIFGTVLPMSKSTIWWIRGWDFPRQQNFVIGVLCFLFWAMKATEISLMWHDLMMMATLLVTCVIQGAFMYPYTFLYPKEARDMRPGPRSTDADIKLVVANVLMTNTESKLLLEDIERENPDLFLALEVDKHWIKRLKPLSARYPHRIIFPQSNYYGMALYSRLPFISPEVKFLIQKDVPSIHTRVRLRDGREVALFCLHPQPPGPTGDDRSVERDAELLLVGKMVRELELPIIVAGDMNDVAWSRSTSMFLRISRLLDPRRGRGFFNTFNAHVPLLMRWSLDHVFHSHQFAVVGIRKLRYNGSDHFPVLLHLNLEQQNANETPQRRQEPSGGVVNRVCGFIDSCTENDFAEAEHTIRKALARGAPPPPPLPSPYTCVKLDS